MNVEPDEVVRAAQQQLVPLLRGLEAALGEDRRDGSLEFFSEIRRWIERAAEEADLMGPFMQLATTAFRDFDFDLGEQLLIDRILEIAQTISATLSADDRLPH